MTELGLPRDDAEVLFEDVKRFLSLESDKPLAPTEAVDKGWHLFILFTADYEAFCMKYFGRFIHHTPEDPFEKKESRDPHMMSRTRELAMASFGSVSDNWAVGKTTCSGSGCMHDPGVLSIK